MRTDTLWAQSLGIRKALTVYLPPSYASRPSRRYPVLIYLHGLSGNERNWVEQGRIARVLDSLAAAGTPEAIVVMPDGDDGWYTTWNQLVDAGLPRRYPRREPAATYCVPWPHYDDYIASDIVAHVDRRYRTQRHERSRAASQASAWADTAPSSLALAYPDVFAAAASHSGVLSPRILGPKPSPRPRATPATPRSCARRRGCVSDVVPAFGRDTIGWVGARPGPAWPRD